MINFYYASGSPYAWRAWLALEHKALPYELKSMSFSDGDLKTADYLQINPRGKVPSIVDSDFALYESAAILEYLDERYPDSGKRLFPGDTRNRAHVRRLINEADLYLDHANRQIVGPIMFTKREDWDEQKIERGRLAVAAELDRFEAMCAGEFFAGELSAADFTIYPMIALALRMNFRRPETDVASLMGPKVRSWTTRMGSLSIVEKTFPPHWK